MKAETWYAVWTEDGGFQKLLPTRKSALTWRRVIWPKGKVIKVRVTAAKPSKSKEFPHV